MLGIFFSVFFESNFEFLFLIGFGLTTIGLFLGIPGIVFSSISKKSKNATNVPTIGQALSIVGIIFSVIVSTIFIAVIIGVSAFVIKNN